MKVLHLVLKNQWYSMIERGEKKEEYRRITQYWINRFCSKENAIKGFSHVCFHLGYTNTTMTYEIKDFVIGKGKAEWGAPEEEVFIIKLGKRL